MSNGFNDSNIYAEGALYEFLAVARNGASAYVYSVGAKLSYVKELFANYLNGVSLVGGVIAVENLALF